MQVLEKILEEIEEVRDRMKSPVAADCFGKDCENDDCTVCVCERAMEIIRSHMNDTPYEDVGNKRLIDANALDEEVMNFFMAITGNQKQGTIVSKCKESFRRMIYEQPTVYVDDDWIDCKKAMPGKDMDKQPVWIVYGSHGNLSVEFAYCALILSEDEHGNDASYIEFCIDRAPQPYHPSLNLVHYWKPVNIPKFEKE